MRIAAIVFLISSLFPAAVYAVDCSPKPPSCAVLVREVERTGKELTSQNRELALAQAALTHAQTRATALGIKFTQRAAVLQARIPVIDQRNANRLNVFTANSANNFCRLGCDRFDALVTTNNRLAEAVRVRYQKYLTTRPILDLQGALVVQNATVRVQNAVSDQSAAQANAAAATTQLTQCRAQPPIPQC